MFVFDNSLLLGVDCFSAKRKSSSSRIDGFKKDSIGIIFSFGLAIFFLKRAYFVPFLSKTGSEVDTEDTKIKPALKNFHEAKILEPQYFTDMLPCYRF